MKNREDNSSGDYGRYRLGAAFLSWRIAGVLIAVNGEKVTEEA